jgi:hypothetical protein
MDEITEFDGFMAAVSSGSRRSALEALRERLAAAVLLAEPRELAPLARQLQIVLTDLDAMTVGADKGKGGFLDELSSRRRSGGKSAS